MGGTITSGSSKGVHISAPLYYSQYTPNVTTLFAGTLTTSVVYTIRATRVVGADILGIASIITLII
jgi:hypothetical protein